MPHPEELLDADRKLPNSPPAMFERGAGTTESALAFPSVREFFRLCWTAIRLKCPNCGVGYVLKPWATPRPRCEHCRFRFVRSGDFYFSGSMLANLAVAEGLFAVVFVTVMIATWPNVPWDMLTWALPAGVALTPILMLPFAKVAWLTFDVMFRPIVAEEFDPVT